MTPRHPVTLQIRGEVYAVGDEGIGILIGDAIWPAKWPADRSIKRPQVGEFVACLLIPHGGRTPVYTLDHPPTVESIVPARRPAKE